MARRYWLVKSEPGSYSIDDLERDGKTMWDGVRNYQARNTMRDDMKVGDLVLFHHSSAKPPGVAGVARVCSKPYADPSAFRKGHKYHDPKSDPDDPTWFLVDLEFVEKFPEVVPLAALKAEPKLDGMLLLKRGMRLSVQPLEKKHFDLVRKLGRG
jgi:predicted RNA-binding protein with PUA-like domain